jgi:pimeloyl-ACP methyl ester carboxylesterase
VLVLPGWGAGPELLAALVPPGAPVAAADWDAARAPDELVPLALAAAARLGGAFTIVAWSLGAMVALEALPALAGRAAALHLLAPCLRFTESWPERVLARMRRRCAEDPAGVLAGFARSMAAPGETILPLRTDRPAAALLAGLDYLAGRALAPPAPVPGCRVRIVHGEADPIVPADRSLPIADALGAERLVLPRAGHAPQLTRTAECAAFLALEGARAPR